MSRMIKETRHVQSESLLKTTLRKITYNAGDFKATELNRWNNQIQQRQANLLKNICERITLQERQNIRKLAREETKQEYKKLKHRMRKQAERHIIDNIMDCKKDGRGNDLSAIMKVKTQFVDLGQKYNKRINMKMKLFNEANFIDDQKVRYAKWSNTVNNSPTNSPIYKKINYLMEKVNEKSYQNGSNTRLPFRSRINQQIIAQKDSNKYIKINRSLSRPVDLPKTKKKN